MSSRKERNIFNVIFPFYLLMKLFGLLPVSFDGEPRLGVFKVKWYDKFLSALAVGFMAFVTAMHIFYPIKRFNASAVVIRGFQTSLSCALSLSFLAIAYQIYKKNEILRILHFLNDFDITARKLELKQNFLEQNRKVLKLLVIVLFGILFTSIGTAVVFEAQASYGDGYKMPLSYGYVLIYFALLILQFSFATFAVKSRFRLLNDNLVASYISTRNSTVNLFVIGRDQLPNVITSLYSQLCDCIDVINDTFTLQLIPFLVYYLSVNVFTIYSMVREVSDDTSAMLIAIVTNFCWFILHTSLASIALHAGHTTTRCALKTPIIVSRIVRCQQWKESSRVVRVFQTFLLEGQYRNVKLENQFFRIDWKLLFSMISTITTFLVITCQFDTSTTETTAKNSTLD